MIDVPPPDHDQKYPRQGGTKHDERHERGARPCGSGESNEDLATRISASR
jgi:hypothetical protein